MGRTSDKDRVKKWLSRVTSAVKAKRAWEQRFDVDYLEKLYIGEHDNVDSKYTINLCYPSVETRLSMMTVEDPNFRVEAKQPRSDDQGTNIEARARLREDTLNCFIQDDGVGFTDTTSLGVKEAHFRFAVAEIVYSNDFIDNPNADKPILDDSNADTGNVEPAKMPDPENADSAHEYVKIKRIPACDFIVSLNAKNTLEECDWCGYRENHLVNDVKANPNYSNTTGLKATLAFKKDLQDPTPASIPDDPNESKEGMCTLWKIWDMRAEKRYVFAEGGDKFLLEEDYDIFPFAALKFHELPDEWYPLPPMFNWRDPQKSLNMTREAQMSYLGSAYTKYIYRDGAIDESELLKLEERRFGVYAKANGGSNLADVLAPVAVPPMDASFWRNVPQSKEDFIQISAVSSEQRGVPDSNTATQANIVDVNSKRREVKDATKVAAWMSKIARILLETITKRMALPFWIKTNVDPTGPNVMQEAAGVMAVWKEITSDQLGDLNYEVSISVESLSPTSDSENHQKWMNILNLLGNPIAVAALKSSKILLQNVTGFKSDRDMAEVQKALDAALQTFQQMQQAKAGPGGPPQAGPPGPGGGPQQLLQMLMQGGGQQQ